MTLQAQWNLTYNDLFRSRARACLTNEAAVFGVGDVPEEVLLSQAILMEDAQKISTYLTILAGYRDFDVLVDNGDGTVDSTKLTDDQIVEAVDILFPKVAELFYGGDSPPVVPSTVTDVAPKSGAAGRNVTITGTGLTDATLVNIGYDCTDLVVVSDTQLTAVTASPKPPTGNYPVLVTVAGTVITGPQYQVT